MANSISDQLAISLNLMPNPLNLFKHNKLIALVKPIGFINKTGFLMSTKGAKKIFWPHFSICGIMMLFQPKMIGSRFRVQSSKAIAY